MIEAKALHQDWKIVVSNPTSSQPGLGISDLVRGLPVTFRKKLEKNVAI